MECWEIDELLAAYVLRALPDEQRSAVELHLASCSQHRDPTAELERSTALLSFAAKDRQPRPELGARIFEAIRAEAAPSVITLGWTTEPLPLGSHVCVFHSDEERLKQTMAFLRTGLDQPAAFGVILADRSRFAALLGWLQEGYHGSVRSLIDRGKLALIGGAPRSEQLLQRIGQRLDQAMDEGYSVIRLLGFIGWDQPGWPDASSLVEFESRVDKVAGVYPAVIVCTYGCHPTSWAQPDLRRPRDPPSHRRGRPDHAQQSVLCGGLSNHAARRSWHRVKFRRTHPIG